MSKFTFRFIVLPVVCSLLVSFSRFNIVRANGSAVYIKANGSIDPQGTPISTIDNVTYTFTGNIFVGVVVERDNIVIDGAGYSIRGTSAGDTYGISLNGRSNVTMKNIEIEAFWYGIELVHSSKNIICGNNITYHWDGIVLASSSNNVIYGNVIAENYDDGIWLESSSNNSISKNRIYGSSITDHDYGITLHESSYNRVSGNAIANIEYGIGIEYSMGNSVIGNTIMMTNQYGIWLLMSSNNSIYHNNFVNNAIQSYVYASVNVWDDGYPSGGNYWSDYDGIDFFSGPYQNVTESDGICDAANKINENNIDHYPLMSMFYGFDVTWQEESYRVNVISNSTVVNFDFGMIINLETGESWEAIYFQVTGPDNTNGFCRICIPTDLMYGNYTVFISWTEVPYTLLSCSNSTHSYLYFNFTLSTREVIIVPEFPSLIILPLFMIATLLAVIVCKRKHSQLRK